jgi:DNA-binding LytR/AlgR family response regulator
MSYTSPNSHLTVGNHPPQYDSAYDMVTQYVNADELKNLMHQFPVPILTELLMKLSEPVAKKSFLVFKQNKYFLIYTENIAYFYVKYELPLIKCFDQKEYLVNHSLKQIQVLITDRQFFRINRQYLINFKAIREVEHYLSRKLLVNLVIPNKDKLLVPKERANDFLSWLDNR